MTSKVWVAVLLVVFAASCAFAQKIDPSSLQQMKWRLVGPFSRWPRRSRGGNRRGSEDVLFRRGMAGESGKRPTRGIPGKPLFDHESTQAIGAIAVAPSDPNIIYVGSGEPCLRNDITFGNGMYTNPPTPE